jgi:UDP-N-acetylmuramoyl-tripeptide--D-alanyl-D-alanine ligase
MTFQEWIEWTHAQAEGVDAARTVTGVTIDSRLASQDHLFVALPGQNTHGHAFVRAVWQQGAVALVESGFRETGGPLLRVDSPRNAMGQVVRRVVDDRGIQVVGITGSVGKTSVKELVHAAIKDTYVTGATQGNYNTAIGIPLSFFGADSGMTHFVAEMGMRFAGEILHLTEMAPPNIAVISNIGPSHLETLGSLDAIQAAKGEILQGLRPNGTAVLNFDDPRVRYLGNTLRNQTVLWYGETQGLDVTIESSQLRTDHTYIRLRWQGRHYEIHLPWLGTHQALNVSAAFLVAIRLGVTPEEAVRGLQAVGRDRSRIRRRAIGSVEVIEDDYNASPVSMQAALAVLAAQPGRRVAILGDILELGSDEEKFHRQVGARAATAADVLITVGERARFIAEEAHAREVPTYVTATREEALGMVRRVVKAGDMILVKASRGMGLDRLVDEMAEWGGPT